MKITSLNNPRVKGLIRLRQAKARREKGLTLIEGRREVERAREAGVVFEEMYCCQEYGGKDFPDSLCLPHAGSKKCFEVTPEVYEKIAFGERREGMVVVARTPRWQLTHLPEVKTPCYVVIEHVEKPGNVGAILRTCDAAGVSAVMVTDPATDIYNPNCVRASLGAVFSVPVVQTSPEVLLPFFQQKKIKIIATLPKGNMRYTDFDYNQPVAVLLGSEEKGLSAVWVRASDACVQIPMCGKVDSLNVSVATAIMVFEILRQRG